MILKDAYMNFVNNPSLKFGINSIERGMAYAILPNFHHHEGVYIRIGNSFYMRFVFNKSKINFNYFTGMFIGDDYLYVYYPHRIDNVVEISTNRKIREVVRKLQLYNLNNDFDKDKILAYLEETGYFLYVNDSLDKIEYEYMNGTKISDLARKYKVTKQRIEQIVGKFVYLSIVNFKKLFRHQRVIYNNLSKYFEIAVGLEAYDIYRKRYMFNSMVTSDKTKSYSMDKVKKPIIFVDVNGREFLLNIVKSNVNNVNSHFINVKVPSHIYSLSYLLEMPVLNIIYDGENYYIPDNVNTNIILKNNIKRLDKTTLLEYINNC